MAQKKGIKPEIKKILRKYLTAIDQQGIKIDKAYIFGSFAKGRTKPWSDIDVCLVSSQFGKDIFEEGVMLAKMARKVDLRIEPHAFNPREFAEKYHPLAAEIKKHGVLVT